MDEMKTFTFRTDRIGDFIISCPFILSYKKKFPNYKITVVTSEYNSKYINSFNFIDKIIPLKNEIKFFPKLLILIKTIFLLSAERFEDIIVLDGKNRSFFISLFLKGKKFIFLQSKSINFISKLFRYNCVFNYQIQNQLKNFSFLANQRNFNIDKDNINIYDNYKFNTRYTFPKKYIIIHIDEKWFQKFYYKDFTDINPSSNQIDQLIFKILNITNNIFDIVLTSGAKNLEVIDDYASSLKLVEENIYEKKINDKIVRYVKNTSFNDLENLVRNSSFLITCEGGISHVSYNLDIETIAFYEKNRLQHMKFWTGHMKKLTLHERKDMKSLLEDANFFNKLKNKVENLV